MSEIDKSLFKPTYTAEDLKALAEAGSPFKNGHWYKFRCVSAGSGVSKAKDYTDPTTGEVSHPKGRQLIYLGWQALRKDGTSLSTKTKEVKQNITLFARPNPDLLKAVGYTDEQIQYAVEGGALDPFVFKNMSDLLKAYDPTTYRAKKDETTGKYNMTVDEQRDRVLAGQHELWVNPEKMKGYEFFFMVRLKVQGSFTNVDLQWPRPSDDPPREADGTASVILDPDEK